MGSQRRLPLFPPQIIVHLVSGSFVADQCVGAVSCVGQATQSLVVVAGITDGVRMHTACRQLPGSCKGTVSYEPCKGWYVSWNESYRRWCGTSLARDGATCSDGWNGKGLARDDLVVDFVPLVWGAWVFHGMICHESVQGMYGIIACMRCASDSFDIRVLLKGWCAVKLARYGKGWQSYNHHCIGPAVVVLFLKTCVFSALPVLRPRLQRDPASSECWPLGCEPDVKHSVTGVCCFHSDHCCSSRHRFFGLCSSGHILNTPPRVSFVGGYTSHGGGGAGVNL